jgi:hypothetical protein
MFVFGTLTVGDRTYGMSDVKSVAMPFEYGLPSHFYGGRIQWVGKTDTDVLVLVERTPKGNVAVDAGAESLAHIPIEALRRMCSIHGISYRDTDTEDGKATTHKELQKFLREKADVSNWDALGTPTLQVVCDRKGVKYREHDEGSEKATTREELIARIKAKASN